MPTRYGKCINFGNCEKADSREAIEVPEGAEFVCPQDGKPLQPVEAKNGGRGPRLAVAALAGFLAVGGIAHFAFFRGEAGGQVEIAAQKDAKDSPPAPESSAALCDLKAMEEAHRKGDCAIVVKMGEVCAAKAPNDAILLNNLATGLLKCGEAQRAGLLLGKAIELKPEDPYLRYNQACVEVRLGNKETAVSQLRKACQFGLAPATFRQDPDLASLIGFKSFEELMRKKCE